MKPPFNYSRDEAKAAFEWLRKVAGQRTPAGAGRSAVVLMAEIKRMHWQLEAADEVFAILVSDDKELPFLPLEGHDEWTDWIVTALKNAGFWQLMRERMKVPE